MTGGFLYYLDYDFDVDIKKVALEPEKVALGAEKVAFERHLSTLKNKNILASVPYQRWNIL